MNTFPLKISSPEGDIFDDSVAKISLRGVEGELCIMAGHIPFVTPVKACDCKIELLDGTEMTGRTDGGILTVSKESTLFLSGSFQWK